MYKLFWEVFKRTGNIEAYLYLYDYRFLSKGKLEKRETLNNNGDCKYPRNSP
ncbi:hypothetical protein [Intestinibacter sp.]|uniref:hypothetical protein n=1 Tax=Intestinibacter sp. TaxID=1965304 RepID=UPI002A755B0B|nr:hypothetical protein [Intestinibacter sp.]MDY2735744.1 hypothetical protein [Intestinibacter sp.]